ncbi:MAG TPA: glycosyltransferase [Gemmatimonadota bacterium]|nr:glycosyltransferase [Gemmatimonadota bacterium]
MSADRPLVSVVVPTRDRPRFLARCLDALAAQRPPGGPFEVVVVDDRSRDPVEPALAAVGDRLDVRTVRGDGAGPAAARNAGAAAARGALLAFTDDDCAPRPGWLAALARAAALRPGAGAGGPAVNVLEEHLCSTASQMLIDHLCERFNEPLGPGRFFTTSSLALPAAAFHEIGGFVAGFGPPGGEDRELCDRWLRSGRPIVWAPDAVVDHAHPLNLAGFWHQHARYGRGARLFHRARLEDGAGRPPVLPPSFYAGLLARPFRTRARRPVRLAALLALSQVANAAGFFRAPGGPPRPPAGAGG